MNPCFINLFLLFSESEAAGSSSLLSAPGLWRWINLIIFVVALIYIFRNKLKIGRIFDDRATAITKELEEAKREKTEAEQKLAEIQMRLDSLDHEKNTIHEEAKREAQLESDRISRTAESDAEKIRQAARREIEGALAGARNQLRAFVAEQSASLAESIIRREIKSEDSEKIVKEYIDELRGVDK